MRVECSRCKKPVEIGAGPPDGPVYCTAKCMLDVEDERRRAELAARDRGHGT